MNSAIDRINPAKLLLSKWTAALPLNKEQHFLVTRICRDEQGNILTCILEAVLTKREQEILWQDLKNNASWMALRN